MSADGGGVIGAGLVADFRSGVVADFEAGVLGCEGAVFGAEPLFGGSGGGVLLSAGLGEVFGGAGFGLGAGGFFIVSLLTFLDLL